MIGNTLTAVVTAVLLVALIPVTVTAAEPVAVVVAVDTSRSLTPGELDAVAAVLQEQVAQLPAGTRSGLVVFNDEASWQVPFGSRPGEVVSGLARLQPRGSFTVLHDALFIAARELNGGGVILLVSDGRDERSATTVEDVARLCTDNGVRVVAASLGRRVDDLALRRLALLTDGTYVGRLPAAGPAVADALDSARAATAAAPPPAVQAPPTTPVTAEDTADAGTRTADQPAAATAHGDAVSEETEDAAGESKAGLPGWLLALGGVALVLLLMAGWFVLRGLRQKDRTCEECGGMLEEWEESCPVCQIKELESAVKTKPVADVAVPDESLLDPKVYVKTPLPDDLESRLENTLVIDEHPVVIVRRSGLPAQTYSLSDDQVFAVGRAPKVNSLQLQDPAISAQHCKLVPKDGEYYVVDLETTNGTFVNRERIKVRKLKPGDIINAGTTELEFGLSIRRLT